MEDPRVERHKNHQLMDIIILTICAVISGAEGWEAIEQFGNDYDGQIDNTNAGLLASGNKFLHSDQQRHGVMAWYWFPSFFIMG